MRSVAALLFLLAVATVATGAGAASAAEFKQPPVGIVRVNTRGRLLARFAVLVYSLNREKKLTYLAVSGCDQRRDRGGERYQMVVTAADAAGAVAKYRAVVWGIPETSQWRLLQFKRMD